jgi:hypothetical protein
MKSVSGSRRCDASSGAMREYVGKSVICASSQASSRRQDVRENVECEPALVRPR